jgi:hypothetical protein
MSDWWIKVHGDRDPSPLVGYQELALAAPVALGGDEARWVSLAGIARLDDDSNVETDPSGLQDSWQGQLLSGRIQIITPFVLAEGELLSSVASAGLASYDIEDAQGNIGWAINFNEVGLQRNDAEGRAEIVVGCAFRGDWGLNRVGFRADLLVRPGEQP